MRDFDQWKNQREEYHERMKGKRLCWEIEKVSKDKWRIIRMYKRECD